MPLIYSGHSSICAAARLLPWWLPDANGRESSPQPRSSSGRPLKVRSPDWHPLEYTAAEKEGGVIILAVLIRMLTARTHCRTPYAPAVQTWHRKAGRSWQRSLPQPGRGLDQPMQHSAHCKHINRRYIWLHGITFSQWCSSLHGYQSETKNTVGCGDIN